MMGFLLRSTLANIVMCHLENIWLESCPSHFKPIVYWQFVDVSSLLFQSKSQAENVLNYLNKQHKKVTFTPEIEECRSLSFFDIKIKPENNKFVIPVYRKPTFSSIFTNF